MFYGWSLNCVSHSDREVEKAWNSIYLHITNKIGKTNINKGGLHEMKKFFLMFFLMFSFFSLVGCGNDEMPEEGEQIEEIEEEDEIGDGEIDDE